MCGFGVLVGLGFWFFWFGLGLVFFLICPMELRRVKASVENKNLYIIDTIICQPLIYVFNLIICLIKYDTEA